MWLQQSGVHGKVGRGSTVRLHIHGPLLWAQSILHNTQTGVNIQIRTCSNAHGHVNTVYQHARMYHNVFNWHAFAICERYDTNSRATTALFRIVGSLPVSSQSSVTAQVLDLVDDLISPVVSLVRESLGVLVGQAGSQAFHDSARSEILRRDQLKSTPLTAFLLLDELVHLRVVFFECFHTGLWTERQRCNRNRLGKATFLGRFDL